MSCKPIGRPLLDKAVGTETAGRPFFGGEKEIRVNSRKKRFRNSDLT